MIRTLNMEAIFGIAEVNIKRYLSSEMGGWFFGSGLNYRKWKKHRFWSETGFRGLPDHTAPIKNFEECPTPSAIMVVCHSKKTIHSNCIVRYHGVKKKPCTV